MARDDEPEYKEGVDFKWVPMKDSSGNIVKDGKGGAVKTRHFFTRAEKAAMKEAPKAKAASKPKAKAKPKATAKAAPKEAAVSKDALAGYRKGDVTTKSLPGKGHKEQSAPKGLSTPSEDKAPTVGGMKDKPVRKGNPARPAGQIRPKEGFTPPSEIYTNERGVRVQDKPTATPEFKKARQAAFKPKPGMNFNEWRKLGVRHGIPTSELTAAQYAQYKNSSAYAGGGVVRARKGHTDHRKKGLFK